MGKYLEQTLSWGNFGIFLAAAVAMLLVCLLVVCYLIYFERKFIGWMQFRQGPNRTGPFGLFQSMADVLKLLIKEDIIPNKADRVLFILAPGIVYVPSFVVLALIPYTENIYFTDLDVGVLFYVAVSTISVIGFILAGWASNNKFSLLGGMRAAAQLISYAVPLVLSMAGVILISGTLNIREITMQQEGWFWHWNFIPQILGFLVFVVAAVAELNRTPFDLAEAENELIAGYHVEYTGFRFAFFMLAEYTYMIAMAGLATSLFLGGWHSPAPFLDFIPGIIWFVIKWAGCVFFLFWLRSTFPRIRVDQLMSMGWKWLLPISLLNIFITAIYMEIVR